MCLVLLSSFISKVISVSLCLMDVCLFCGVLHYSGAPHYYRADMRLYVVRNYEHQSEESLTRYHRLMWCPQSPLEHDAASDDEDEDDGLPYLAVTNGNLV